MNLTDPRDLAPLLEAFLLASGKAQSLERLYELFEEAERPEPAVFRKALEVLRKSCSGRAFELKEVASGYRLQIREAYAPWVGRLWEERPQRYSRALLETIALIAYRQPITRGEIEDVRGVAVNTNIIKTLLEREWVRIVGYREVPGKPAMFATTKAFLDHFNLKNLDELPSLAELREMEPEPLLEVDDAPVPAAKGFWIHHKMSKAAVDWLNGALVGGTVRDGRAIVTGDLDDWPFTRQNGRFEAVARIEDGQFKFQHDWPQVEQVHGDIAFIGNGFLLKARGMLADVAVPAFEAGIADFGEGDLKITARTDTDSARLLALLRQSPLRKTYGETLDHLQAKGPVAATFDLLQPLRAERQARKKLAGTVELKGAQLSETRWDLVFDNMRGKAKYDDGGFASGPLQVVHEGQPGVLGLRAAPEFEVWLERMGIADTAQGLRLREGIDLAALADRFGLAGTALIDADKAAFYARQGLVWQRGSRIGVTAQGLPLLDGLLGELVRPELVTE